MILRLIVVGIAAFVLSKTHSVAAQELKPLKYNNDSLIVDLGVGLWAWPLPVDFDRDGDVDLLVSCPDKPYNGLYLFERTGGVTAPFKRAKRIDKGLRNVRMWNGVGPSGNRSFRLLGENVEYLSFADKGFREARALRVDESFHKIVGTKSNKTRARQWNLVDFNGDGVLDISIGIGDWSDYGWDDAFDSAGKWTNGLLHGFVYVAINKGTNDSPKYTYPEKVIADGAPVDVYGWPSPNFADFDGDGDLDLLCGEFLDRFTYFENVGDATNPKYASGERLQSTDGSDLRMDLQMIVPCSIDFDNDGDVDLVVGDEDGRVAYIANTGTVDSGLPLFDPPKYLKQNADLLKCGALSTPYAYDWDSDGDEDIICGNTAGYIELFENLGGTGSQTVWAAPTRLSAGGQPIRIQAGRNGSIQGPCEAKWGYTTLSIGDWDHDGRHDIVANSIWGKVVWFRNIGDNRTPKLEPAQAVSLGSKQRQSQKPTWNWWSPAPGELVTQWRTTPYVVDWNEDGLNDIVMLDHEGYLALYRRFEDNDGALSLSAPQRVFVDEAMQPLRLNHRSAGGSGRRKIAVADWDGDGLKDILVNSVNADWYRNVGRRDGKYVFRHEGPIAKRVLSSHTTSPAVCDLNRDGKLDLLLGAEDGHIYYLPSQ